MEPSEQKLEKARGEIALLALMGMLLIPVGLTLFLADSRIDPRALAALIVGIGFFLPVLMLKGALRDRPEIAVPVAAASASLAAFVATFQIWITVAALVCGGVGGLLFHRIRTNQNYRPRLRGE